MFKFVWFYLSVGKKEKSFYEKILKWILNIFLIVCVVFFYCKEWFCNLLFLYEKVLFVNKKWIYIYIFYEYKFNG